MAFQYLRGSEPEDESITQQANNRRLRQAIGYLTTEGGSDSPAQYVQRVDTIEREILRRYMEEGYDYDPGLYRRLRTMVREVQSDFNRAFEEEDHSTSAEEEDIVEIDSPSELLRRASNVQTLTAKSAPQRDGLPPRSQGNNHQTPVITLKSRSQLPGHPMPDETESEDATSEEELAKVRFRYGGPDNEFEYWYKNHPPALPFGETLLMQKWESAKINYDLRESMKPNQSVVETNVKLPSISDDFPMETVYDSGSRFRFPKITKEVRDVLSKHQNNLKLNAIVDKFNKSNGENDGEERQEDYAPRVFLEHVHQHPDHRNSLKRFGDEIIIRKINFGQDPVESETSSGFSDGPINTLTDLYHSGVRPEDNLHTLSPTTPRTSIAPSTPRPSSVTKPTTDPSSRTGTAGPGVQDILRRHPQTGTPSRVPASPKQRTTPKQTQPSRVVRALSDKRSEAQERTTRLTPEPTTSTTLSHVAISPRSNGRPRKRSLMEHLEAIDEAEETAFAHEPTTPTPAKERAPRQKRKTATDDGNAAYPEPVQNKARTKSTPPKRKRVSEVSFAEYDTYDDDEGIVVHVPESNLTPKKSAVAGSSAAKGKAKKMSKASQAGKQKKAKPAPPTKAAEGYNQVKRGTLRSGTKFKAPGQAEV